MRIQDKIKQKIDLNSPHSIKRGFGLLYAVLKKSNPSIQKELLNIAEYLRTELKDRDDFLWKSTLKQVDYILVLMRKEVK